MNSSPHILIAGGGIGGLTAAIILAKNGQSIEVFEQAEKFSEIGAGIQLSPNAMHILAAAGLKTELLDKGFEPQFAALRDYKSGTAYLKTPLKPLCQARYGVAYLHIHRADLHEALRLAAEAAGVQFHMGTKILTYENTAQNRVKVETSKGPYTGRLLIGADGVRSAIRSQIYPDHHPRFTGQTAWRGTIAAHKLPENIIAPAANVWIGPEKHFVAYYIKGGEHINFVAVEERAEWREEDWSIKGDKRRLQQSFKNWHHPVMDLIAACDAPYLWGLFDHAELPSWQDKRAILIGDAAHPMLPFMAQGAAMAIEDGWILAQTILTQNDDIKALKIFETIRKPRATRLQNMSRRNAQLFHENRKAALLTRRVKFALAQHIMPLQHFKLDPIYSLNLPRDYPLKRSIN